VQKNKISFIRNINFENLIIFGAGHNGNRLYRLFKLLKINVDMFFDNSPEKWEQTIVDEIICKMPVVTPDNKDNLIIVSIEKNQDEVKNDLLIKGFSNIVLIHEIENELHNAINEMIDDFGIDLVSYMAETGNGTDKCLMAGVYPMQVHFYQPVPDLKDLERRNVWSKVSDLGGIEWNNEKFSCNMEDVSKYQPKKDWARKATENNMEFHLDNDSFSYLCASFLYGIISKNRPKRIIEIGSGNSSKVIRQALIDNECHSTEYTIIDPFCVFEKSQFFPVNVNIMQVPVEETDIGIFKQLEKNDILFIDSSHTVRIGGDVNFEILDVLPVLAKGVFIHFHDIELPYEYSKIYATRTVGRFFWTESYLVQAFLAFNNAFEIFIPVLYLCKNYLETIKKCYPSVLEPRDWSSGSFWIKKCL
jgi:hypothetical protein